MRICFATHNQNKVREIAQIAPAHIEIVGLSDIGITEEVEETGVTMEENSLLKANYVYEKHKIPVFADDSGLEVDALNGAPGLYSARYAKREGSDLDNISLLLENLKSQINKKANFKTVISYINENGSSITFEGIADGQITETPRGENGFGYDPIFIPDGHDRTFAEMSADEKNALSHRSKAFNQLLVYLNSLQ